MKYSCFEVDWENHVAKTHTGFGGAPFYLLKLLCSFLSTKATYANYREKTKQRQEKLHDL